MKLGLVVGEWDEFEEFEANHARIILVEENRQPIGCCFPNWAGRMLESHIQVPSGTKVDGNHLPRKAHAVLGLDSAQDFL